MRGVTLLRREICQKICSGKKLVKLNKVSEKKDAVADYNKPYKISIALYQCIKWKCYTK